MTREIPEITNYGIWAEIRPPDKDTPQQVLKVKKNIPENLKLNRKLYRCTEWFPLKTGERLFLKDPNASRAALSLSVAPHGRARDPGPGRPVRTLEERGQARKARANFGSVFVPGICSCLKHGSPEHAGHFSALLKHGQT